jgi:hypothetical protein
MSRAAFRVPPMNALRRHGRAASLLVVFSTGAPRAEAGLPLPLMQSHHAG